MRTNNVLTALIRAELVIFSSLNCHKIGQLFFQLHQFHCWLILKQIACWILKKSLLQFVYLDKQ